MTKPKKRVTIGHVMAWNPCYTLTKVCNVFGKRTTLTAKQIAKLRIPTEDKVWALLHKELISNTGLEQLACDFAKHVLPLCGKDRRPKAAIKAKQRWLRGRLSDEELEEACDAVWESTSISEADTFVEEYARTSAWYAATYLIDSHVRNASRYAALAVDETGANWQKEWEWQLERIVEVIEKEGE